MVSIKKYNTIYSIAINNLDVNESVKKILTFHELCVERALYCEQLESSNMCDYHLHVRAL